MVLVSSVVMLTLTWSAYYNTEPRKTTLIFEPPRYNFVFKVDLCNNDFVYYHCSGLTELSSVKKILKGGNRCQPHTKIGFLKTHKTAGRSV